MFPQPKSRPEYRPNPANDALVVLEHHLRAGFPPDLALDLVLNEIVVQAAHAVHADAAALALTRGQELVCRAATGQLAPDLDVPLNSRDGLSGACVQTHQPQLSADTEFDPRVDPVVSRRLGIRSILIVPVFDANDRTRFEGILEAFSSSPAAFSHTDQKTLETFALECARMREASLELAKRRVEATPVQISVPELAYPEVMSADVDAEDSRTATFIPPVRKPLYETWALALGGLTIAAAIAVSFLIGSRVGWFGVTPMRGQTAGTTTERNVAPALSSQAPGPSAHNAPNNASTKLPATPPDELVVYEKGKVVFRMKPAPAARGTGVQQQGRSIVEASSTTRIPGAQSVWIAPAQAEARLVARIEPLYPEEALSARRSGNVVLEVQVAEDGAVSGIRTISGDPALAAAATEAVRSWRYQPYRQHDRPTQFQTDVTLTFALPN